MMLNKAALKRKWVHLTGTNAKTMTGFKRAVLRYLSHYKPENQNSDELSWSCWYDDRFEKRAQSIMMANGLMTLGEAEALADEMTVKAVMQATGHDVYLARLGEAAKAEWILCEKWIRYGRQSYSRGVWRLVIVITMAGAQESVRSGKLVLDVIDGVPVIVSITQRPYAVRLMTDVSLIKGNRVITGSDGPTVRRVKVVTDAVTNNVN